MNRLFSSFRKPIVVSLLTSAFVQPISYSDSSTSSNNPTRTFKKDFVPNRLTFKAIEDDNDMVTVISRTADTTVEIGTGNCNLKDFPIDKDIAKENLIKICKSNQMNDVLLVQQILSQHPSLLHEGLNQGNQSLLICASQGNKIELVKYLLELPGFDYVNQRQRYQSRTALHIASYYGHIQIVELLLAHPLIDVNLQTNAGSSALYIASYRGFVDVVKALLSHPKIDIHLKFNTGDTARSACCRDGKADQNNKETILTLLKRHTEKSATTGKSLDHSHQLQLLREKYTDVMISHDWGKDGSNHDRVKLIDNALRNHNLKTWFDDQKIINDIDGEIMKGIDNTKCMIVVLTENYFKSLKNEVHRSNYCRKEFLYGVEKLGPKNMFLVVLDAKMKDRNNWGDFIKFHLPTALYHDLTFFDNSGSIIDEEGFQVAIGKLAVKIRCQIEENNTS